MKSLTLLIIALVPAIAYQGKTALPVAQFKIVHSVQGLRFDGGMSFYVLISRPNMQTPAFKNQIKAMIKLIVADQGGKISIDVYDDAAVLERKYQADNSPQRTQIRSKQQMESDALHFIAGFSGQLSTEAFLNTLYFFPGADKGTPVVGRHCDVVEFNPR